MDFTLKSYSCSSCNKDETRLLLTKQGYSIVTCAGCGFVYVNPRVENEQLISIYKHNYFKNKDYGYIGYEQEKRLRIKNFTRWLKDAEKFVTADLHINSLDVGCAAGYCLELMNARGWKSKGLELDEEMCVVLQEGGYDISRSSIEDFETDMKFSVITLFDVIEHIPNIDTAFSKLCSLLTPDGVVIMVTPDHNSFQRKLLARRWFQYKPIEHIQYFDEHSLNTFAARNGLQVIHKKRCGQYADSNFLVNRLIYYHYPFLAKIGNSLFRILGLKDKFIYTDTGSLFVILNRR